MMALRPIILLGISIVLLGGFTEGLGLTIFNKKVLPTDCIDFTSKASSPCKCRSKCMTNTSCTGVSVQLVASALYQCSFTSRALKDNLLLNSTDNDTYFKKTCPSTFTMVAGVGCIKVSTDMKNYNDAQASCPPGSALFSPATDSIYWNLAAYLSSLGSSSYKYWIGVEGNTSKKPSTWNWRDGGSFLRNVGQDPRGHWEPNGGEKTICTNMLYEANISYFHLSEDACSQKCRYVCQMT